MTGATNQPLVSRHQATWWRWVEGCEGKRWEPDVGGWRKMRRRGWQWERIWSWNSYIRLWAPRREIGWIASRSSHTEAPLRLLLHVPKANLFLLLLCLCHLQRLCPPQLLSLGVHGIGLLDGEQEVSSMSQKLLHFILSHGVWQCTAVASPPDIMSEILVPLLELPVTKKAPAGKLPSKADFLCLLYGSVEGNFEGFQGKIFLSLLLH